AVAGHLGGEQQEEGAHTLAAALGNVAAQLVDDADLRSEIPGEILFHRLELRPHQAQDVGEDQTRSRRPGHFLHGSVPPLRRFLRTHREAERDRTVAREGYHRRASGSRAPSSNTTSSRARGLRKGPPDAPEDRGL